ncbi:MAG: two-component system, NtrC family,C4-dicarboxylate transport sensor histidine kinase DctB [Sphingomonadales bacterium]|nr:two-component system, NtrC family,C4-dicarboxylate transport sensor histidine kinase DctB [Sphingomonadales bacterium]
MSVKSENDVGAVAERNYLRSVVEGLQDSVSLRLIRDISFDPTTHLLSFVEGSVDHPAVHALLIDAAGQPDFQRVANSDAASVEFRLVGAEMLDAFLITLGKNIGNYGWEQGTIVALRQPRRLRELIASQARLVDLGSLAAMISHEVKQPLFTIAMIAESIQIILRKPAGPTQGPNIEQCARRIVAQVDRAREIIRRTLKYGRSDATITDCGEPVTALMMAFSLLLPLLDERDMEVVMDLPDSLPEVGIAQIALEQLLVNAIRNGSDAILSARAAGRVAGRLELYAFVDGNGVRCGVRDDGLGLEKAAAALAFDAFFTTKPVDEGSGLGLFICRQIVSDAAGTITLVANPIAGATLEVWLPFAAN